VLKQWILALLFIQACANVVTKSSKGGMHTMRILRASEDYLETMLMMQRKHGYIRSIDIASYLGVTKPSVSYATKRLRENGYITMDADGLISLTDSGLSIAKKMLERHTALTRFLVYLGVSEETAETDACKMEHDISEETFNAICRHAERHA
jgi:DtxR family Mn-dependent transcriptional regulator